MSKWSYVLVNTRTGAQLSPARPKSGASWGRRLNVNTTGSLDILLADETNKDIPYRACTVPWKTSIVIQRDLGAGFGIKPWIAYAGPITGRKYNWDTKTLTLRYTDIRGLLARRTTLGANGYGGVDGGVDRIQNKTLDSVAAKVIADGLVGPTSNYALPIVLPALVDSVFSFDFWDYNFPFVDKAVESIQNYLGGPDTDFVPRWSTSNTLEYVFRSGYLTGGVFEWNMTAQDNPGLFNVSDDEDALKQTTSTYAVGAGSEVDMKVKWARLDTDLPALERVEQYKQEDDLGKLQDYANADLAMFQNTTHQWSLSILIDGPWPPDQLVLGSTLRLWFKGDLWQPDGWVVLYLIGITPGDTDDKLNLIVRGGGS